MFDKKIRASFQAPSKLPTIYRASSLRVQSKVERAPLPRSEEWSHIQIALMLPESSPSQTCFRTPHCASLLWTHWVISGVPGWLSHFFQQISHRLSDICSNTLTAQLSSPHIWLYKQSGQSCSLMFINWVCSLDLSVTPLWGMADPQAAASIELWWKWVDTTVVLFSLLALQSREAHFMMYDLTHAPHNKKYPDPAWVAT